MYNVSIFHVQTCRHLFLMGHLLILAGLRLLGVLRQEFFHKVRVD
jgi:hypothetical protein